MFPVAKSETGASGLISLRRLFLFFMKNGSKRNDARKKRTNAKLRGGISAMPIFVTGDVAPVKKALPKIKRNALTLSLIF